MIIGCRISVINKYRELLTKGYKMNKITQILGLQIELPFTENKYQDTVKCIDLTKLKGVFESILRLEENERDDCILLVSIGYWLGSNSGSISEISKAVHQNAKDKGFWNDIDEHLESVEDRDIPFLMESFIAQKLSLIHSEISECLEARRKGLNIGEGSLGQFGYNQSLGLDFSTAFEQFIKNTDADELADAVIRIFDLAEWLGIDIEWHIRRKHEYNKTRPHKHGKSY